MNEQSKNGANQENLGWVEAIKEVAKEHWDLLPLATVCFASFVLGLMLVFGDMTFRDPVTSEWTARQIFRAIGAFLMWCPIWLLVRIHRGYYAEVGVDQ